MDACPYLPACACLPVFACLCLPACAFLPVLACLCLPTCACCLCLPACACLPVLACLQNCCTKVRIIKATFLCKISKFSSSKASFYGWNEAPQPFRNKAIYSIGKLYCMKGKNILRTKSKRYSTVSCWETNARDSNYVLNTRGNASDSNITIHAKAIILGNECR
jgi:hypothetical protein